MGPTTRSHDEGALFGETLVSMIFEQENMKEVYPLKQWEKINELYRHDIIEDEIYKKFEYIRKNVLQCIKRQMWI